MNTETRQSRAKTKKIQNFSPPTAGKLAVTGRSATDMTIIKYLNDFCWSALTPSDPSKIVASMVLVASTGRA